MRAVTFVYAHLCLRLRVHMCVMSCLHARVCVFAPAFVSMHHVGLRIEVCVSCLRARPCLRLHSRVTRSMRAGARAGDHACVFFCAYA